MYKMTTKEGEKTKKKGGKMKEGKHHQANVEESLGGERELSERNCVVPGEFRRPGRRYVT